MNTPIYLAQQLGVDRINRSGESGAAEGLALVDRLTSKQGAGVGRELQGAHVIYGKMLKPAGGQGRTR